MLGILDVYTSFTYLTSHMRNMVFDKIVAYVLIIVSLIFVIFPLVVFQVLYQEITSQQQLNDFAIS